MSSSIEITVYRLLISSSFFTKVILLLLVSFSIISWAIMIQKYLFISRYRNAIGRFINAITNQGTLDNVEEICTTYSNTVAKTVPVIMMKLIRSRNQGRQLLSPETILSNAVYHEASRLQSMMNILATTANTSPLIGLLGTVWGVMYAFVNISEQQSATIGTVAPGIAEALTTTIFGLIVAIPAMAGHNFLAQGINRCMDYLERSNEFGVKILSGDDAI